MIKFPETTIVNKIVPKTAFYKHLEVNSSMKTHFVDDVERIVWSNKLAPSTLNVSDGKLVHEITVFTVVLKNKDCPSDIFVFIDKNLPRHTVFFLSYEGERSILINYKEATQANSANPYKVTETYRTSWNKSESASLVLEGSSLDLIYENMVRQIAGATIVESTQSLKSDIEISQKQELLRREISALKTKLNAERQPQKKFLLHQQLIELERKLIEK